MSTFRKNHKAVETRFFDEPVLVTLDDSLKKALEFMAHGKGTDDPSSSLFAKRHQVSERHSGVLKSFPLGAGGYTSQQLQRLGLETHVLHSQAHSTRAGRVNLWSRTIQVRPDRRHELSTRLTESVNYRPRRHLFGYRHERAASGFQVGDHSFLSLSTGRLVVESRHGRPPCRLTE